MPTPQDHSYMHLALAQASAAADIGEVPVGAIIVHNDDIIAATGNRCEERQDATAHAEMLAIQEASTALGTWRLEDCTMYVTLEPCPMCMGAALNSRIKRIVFGANEPKAGACGSVVDLSKPIGYNHQIEVEGGLLAAESADLLKQFFRRLRKTKPDQ